MAFKSYSQNWKKSYQVVFEKKLKITTKRRTRAPRRGRSYRGSATKNKSSVSHLCCEFEGKKSNYFSFMVFIFIPLSSCGGKDCSKIHFVMLANSGMRSMTQFPFRQRKGDSFNKKENKFYLIQICIPFSEDCLVAAYSQGLSDNESVSFALLCQHSSFSWKAWPPNYRVIMAQVGQLLKAEGRQELCVCCTDLTPAGTASSGEQPE